MSSYLRHLQRKFMRKQPDHKTSPQLFISLPNGGYKTRRPTKDWIKISGKRLAAQLKMANLLGGKK